VIQEKKRKRLNKRSTMEILTIPAIYEDGKLRPLTPLPLQNEEKVLLRVIRHSAVQETQGLLQGIDPEVVQEVAEGDEFSVLT
jgi:predicted DNA-binding antitoxin AbrB/MazE fold protein